MKHETSIPEPPGRQVWDSDGNCTDFTEAISEMTAPSSGGKPAIEGDPCVVRPIVLAPNTGNVGTPTGCATSIHETKPLERGIFFNSWQYTRLMGNSGFNCIPTAQPARETTRYGPTQAESSLHFFAGE